MNRGELIIPTLLSHPNKNDVWTLIEKEEHWTSRKKAQVRFLWKKKNDPHSIQTCPAKGRRCTKIPQQSQQKDQDDKKIDTPSRKEWWTWIFHVELNQYKDDDLLFYQDCWHHRIESHDLFLFKEMDHVWEFDGGQDGEWITGSTALHMLCSMCFETLESVERVERLTQDLIQKMEKKALLRNDLGNTPFHEACRHGLLSQVRLFLEAFPISLLNTRNNEGETGFHLACQQGHLEVVMLLYNREVDIKIKDQTGRSGIDWADEHDHIDVLQFLRDR